MQKLLFLFLFLQITYSNTLKADQLKCLSYYQAKKAVEYLQTQKEVISYCSLCSDQKKQKIKLSAVYYQKSIISNGTNYHQKCKEGNYMVFIKGYTSSGKEFHKSIDLAYIYINKSAYAHSLGILLGFECNPGTNKFSWSSSVNSSKSNGNYQENNKTTYEVYICNSPKAYAYHKGYCRGLKRCSYSVTKVSQKTAKTKGRKACGFCY